MKVCNIPAGKNSEANRHYMSYNNIKNHRTIGRELDLFHVQDDAAGSIFWHPRGYTLYNTIEQYIRGQLVEYQEVKTPQLINESLWHKTGHWDKFKDNMFVATGASDVDGDGRIFAIKPMNCPGHVQIFNNMIVSYKNLPIRLSEFGCCHRNEPSGALDGIMRVRQFTQDDAHIFCTEDQIQKETTAFCNLLMRVYQHFGFTNVKVGFSTRPTDSTKRAGDDATWDLAETALADAVKTAGLTYDVYEGEGAFYGPKLEFALTDHHGREWQCGTLQLDMILPARLGAKYTAQDGSIQTPIMLHRAILGSFERFIGILLEHHAGNLPFWLQPVQFAIISVKPENDVYARSIAASIDCKRAIVDDRECHMTKKVKDHMIFKIPYLVIVGPNDEKNDTVSIRKFGTVVTDVIPRSDFITLAINDMIE